mmetsp:Transcript_16389/g.41591  ORF Transcript_16389/g.41591 Transcript_16389/m.41591 type:complete len:453 (-) Transcript_16389:172-1530(-)
MHAPALRTLIGGRTLMTPRVLASLGQLGRLGSGVSTRSIHMSDNPHFDVVIVGAGAAGVAVASSMLNRKPNLQVCIIDPATTHYYQPGWTMVGGGLFTPESTGHFIGKLLPQGVTWVNKAVKGFSPSDKMVHVENCKDVTYDKLVVCPGIKLDWDKVEGLPEALGKNGVTSNYRYDLAPYTWKLVQNMKSGKAIFTNPPMPIKCAGAPQKAMYLSADHWFKQDVLKNIDIQFNTALGVLFGVKDYVPALMEYVKKYDATLNFFHNLEKIDGEKKVAYFRKGGENPSEELVPFEYDMIHVAPPQSAPDFIKASPLADAAGWVDVDQSTLQHHKYEDIYALGDCISAPNAKTAAAARAQAPVVAYNVLADMGVKQERAVYSGYGSCPLTVERGKVVLAEFSYGGMLSPSLPKFLIDGTRPSRLGWLLKETILPPFYWYAMLRGREWLVQPKVSL